MFKNLACSKISHELSRLRRRRDLSGKGKGELEGHSQRGYVAIQEKKRPSEGYTPSEDRRARGTHHLKTEEQGVHTI